MIEGILIGLNTALSLQNIIIVMIGCFAGTIIGMLPGLGPMTAIALMIPITYGFDPASGLILMAGVYYGAVFGGSTSSILLVLTMIVYGATILKVGFFLSTSLFLVFSYYFLGERRWKYIIIFSFPFVAIFMYLLHGVLAVYLRDPLLKYIGIMG